MYINAGDAEVKIDIPNPIHYGEPTVGSCVVSGLSHPILRFIKIGLEEGKEACNVTLTNKLDINHPYCMRNFTVTCNNNTRSLGIKCAAITVVDGINRLQVHGKLIS